MGFPYFPIEVCGSAWRPVEPPELSDHFSLALAPFEKDCGSICSVSVDEKVQFHLPRTNYRKLIPFKWQALTWDGLVQLTNRKILFHSSQVRRMEYIWSKIKSALESVTIWRCHYKLGGTFSSIILRP